MHGWTDEWYDDHVFVNKLNVFHGKKYQHNPLTMVQVTAPPVSTPKFYNDLEAQELADRDRN